MVYRNIFSVLYPVPLGDEFVQLQIFYHSTPGLRLAVCNVLVSVQFGPDHTAVACSPQRDISKS